MYIKNSTQLLSNDLTKELLKLRTLGLDLIEEAITAVKPDTFIKNNFIIKGNQLTIGTHTYNLNDYNAIHIIGGGKATLEMLSSIEEILSNNEYTQFGGIINIPENQDLKPFKLSGRVEINYASHPIPNKNGITGTKAMMKLIQESSKEDLIVCLISGGGSALLPLPKGDISLQELQKMNSLLLASGASIHEINTIRKHISDFKGGNLAKKLHNSSGATLICLIISDVIGNNFDSIASGPTVPDSTSFQDAYEILKRYSLIEKIPSSVKRTIENGLKNQELENPTKNDIYFTNVHNYLIGSVESAVNEVRNILKIHDFRVNYFSNQISGEASTFGRALPEIILSTINSESKFTKIALIGTGELTVTITGNGKGGRNQEMLLSFLDAIRFFIPDYNFLIVGANLDGIEGNSEVMGALIDNSILTRINEESIDLKPFLDNNDSNSFFQEMNTILDTGPTGCNANDLILILIDLEKPS